jgi:hypothetical protein
MLTGKPTKPTAETTAAVSVHGPELETLLQRRLEIVQRLTQSLEEGHEAIRTRDVARMEMHCPGQLQLCAEWTEIDEQVRAAFLTGEGENSRQAAQVGDRGRWAELRAGVQVAEARLRQAHQVQGALLRRMQRALQTAEGLQHSAAGTYAPRTWAQRM